MEASRPLISVVTPVYNGEQYLSECIESILAQDYPNWEYIIVDNCSTDRTLEIANNYAKKEPRIRIFHNTRLLPIMENWNYALHQISTESKYCKVVHADDWLFPECLMQMAQVGERYPSVGLVGAYALRNSKIACDGLPYPSTIMSGREVCRLTLLKHTYPFLSPSGLLIRSEIIRKRQPFYNELHLHADVEMCYEVLRDYDFGFVHQVLTFLRRHKDSTTSIVAKPLNKLILQNMDLLTRFGPIFLTDAEFKVRLEEALRQYYWFLAKALFEKKDAEFWRYHREGLQRLGYPLSSRKFRGIWLLVLINRATKKFEKKIKFIA